MVRKNVPLKEETSPSVLEARDFGKRAFARGISCVPVHDPEFMDFLGKELAKRNNEFGASLPFLSAWSRGWTAANLATPLPDEEETPGPGH